MITLNRPRPPFLRGKRGQEPGGGNWEERDGTVGRGKLTLTRSESVSCGAGSYVYSAEEFYKDLINLASTENSL